MHFRFGLAIAASVLLSACVTQRPYAIVSGERQQAADPTEASVRIMGVDGKMYPSGWDKLTIEPGQHMVLLRTTRSDGRRMSPDAMLPLDAKPCMRYHVVAKLESSLVLEPWWLVIKKVERIGECVLPEPKPGS